MKKRVEIHVGQLMLHGLQAGQRRAAREAVERELTLLGTQGKIAGAPQLSLSEIRLPHAEKSS